LVETRAKKEALASTDPDMIREVNAAIGEFTKRLMRFNYDEKIEQQFAVKGLLALSLSPGESVNYVGKGRDMSRETCHNCKRTGHWARDCPDKKTGKKKGGGNSGGGKHRGKQLSASEKAEKLKTIKCWVCKEKGHYSNKCPTVKKEGANQTEEQTGDDRFSLNMVHMVEVDVDFDIDARGLLVEVPARTPVRAASVFRSAEDFGTPSEFDMGIFDVDVALPGGGAGDVVDGSSVGQSEAAAVDTWDEVLTRSQVDPVIDCRSEEEFLQYLLTVPGSLVNSAIYARLAYLDLEAKKQDEDDVNVSSTVFDQAVEELGLHNVGGSFAANGFAIVDSGASTCSEPDADMFVRMDVGVDMKVNTAGGQVNADGLGCVKWALSDSKGKVLRLNVERTLHLQKAERLLSLWQLVQQGHSVGFTPDTSPS